MAAVAGSVAIGLQVAAVASGGSAPGALGTLDHVGWLALSAALVLADLRRARAHLWSFALAAGAAAVHAWLLALVLVVTGQAERSRALRVGVGTLLLASWAGEHLAWRGFDLLGRTQLSLDATGLILAWCHGLFLLAGWIITMVAVERFRAAEPPIRPPPPPAPR